MLRFPSGGRLDRIETIYLAILRVGVLAVASICLLAATFFAIDGLWRILVPTEVKEKATVVAPAEVTAAMRTVPAARQAQGERQIPEAVRAAHAAFSTQVFPAYYAVYKRASDAYRKTEDKTLSQTELMDALGYDLDTYAAGETLATKLFIEDANYQQQAQAAVSAAMTDPATVRLLREYKAAQKTARACSSVYERRRVWDPYSTACSDWFYQPYGCNVTRSVPVERCVPAYPDGIVSPVVAFGRADDAFRTLWASRADANASEAQSTRMDREMTRSQIGPRLMLALQIVGGFLLVMFFFLIIAIERHLRRLSSASAAQEITGPEEKPTS
ncbi:hypothetical protein [Brevundimonas sp.]|uniref:hypothetical protein n=1 Tax=Brevundimonas sp. TaxID=1871086 RepID=UPI003F721D16